MPSIQYNRTSSHQLLAVGRHVVEGAGVGDGHQRDEGRAHEAVRAREVLLAALLLQFHAGKSPRKNQEKS